jgi:hypothetical protein
MNWISLLVSAIEFNKTALKAALDEKGPGGYRITPDERITLVADLLRRAEQVLGVDLGVDDEAWSETVPEVNGLYLFRCADGQVSAGFLSDQGWQLVGRAELFDATKFAGGGCQFKRAN